MRIFSEYTDYYDHIGYFSNEDRVWQRNLKEISLNMNSNRDRIHIGISYEIESMLINILKNIPHIHKRYRVGMWADDRSSDYICIVGFCGRSYVGIVRHISNYKKLYLDFDKYVEDYHRDNPDRELVIPDHRSYYFNGGFNRTTFNDLKGKHEGYGKFDALFIEFQSPIFIIKPTVYNDDAPNIIINPILKDYSFQSYFNPYQANQEVDMYLNNVLTDRENCDIVRTNELIRDSKGMDKFSFKQVGPKARKCK